LGPVAKCAPPLRSAGDQAALWTHLKEGRIATLGSDHSPSPPEMKNDPDFFRVWGGISGIQHTLPLILTEGYYRRDVSLPAIARMTSFEVAARFRLPQAKAGLRLGADADLVLVDLNRSVEVCNNELFYRHPQTPYAGRALTGQVVQTILRGRTIFRNGQIVSEPAGRLVRPSG